MSLEALSAGPLHRPKNRTDAARSTVATLLTATLFLTLAQAALVVQNRPFPALYAERYDGGPPFTVGSTSFLVGTNDRPAMGVESNPVQMTDGFPDARTALTNGHQWYTAVISERTAASVTSGSYTVQVFVQEVLKGTVYVTAGTRTDKVDGATVTWDLGAPNSMPTSPLFLVKVQALVPAPPSGPVKAFGLESMAGDLWRGLSAPTGHANIAGVTNPTLSATTGDSVEIAWTNGDGRSHALQIRNPGGTVVAGPSPTLSNVGQSATVTYGPPSPGNYRYECVFHNGMWGSLAVT